MSIPRSAIAVACVSVASCVILVQIAPQRFFVDDAWFYLQIAHNVASGQGSTFNGAMPTNGYHPLWLAMSALLAALTGGSKSSAVTATVLFQGIFLGLPLLWLVTRLARQTALPYPALTLALVGGAFYANPWYGSEAWLNGLMQVAALSALLRAHASRGERPQAQAARWLLCGALLGVAVLARLDLVFLAGACALSPLLDDRPPRERLRSVALLVAGCGLLVAPYVAWNLWTTGHPVPVSGATKGTFPVPDLSSVRHKLGSTGQALSVGALVGGALSAFGGLPAPLRRLLAVTAVGGLAQVAYVAFFTRWGWSTDQGYYYITPLLCSAFAAPVLFVQYTRYLPSLDARARQRLAAGLALVVAVGAPMRVARNVLEVHEGGLRPVPEDGVIGLARWMDRHLPPDAVIFTFDAPGRLAWFSDRSIIAADGLTGDFDFDGAVRSPDLVAFLHRQGVRGIVAPIDDYATPWGDTEVREGEITIRARGPRSGLPAGVISLRLDDAAARLTDFNPTVLDVSAAYFPWPAP